MIALPANPATLYAPLLAAVIGWLAFPDWEAVPATAYALTLFIPYLWITSPSRLQAALLLACYSAVVTRGIPASVTDFYGTTDPNGAIYGYALYAGTVWLHAALGFLLWSKTFSVRVISVLLLLAFWTLNPAGFGNPLQAAGIIAPASGWWGLPLATALAVAPLLSRWAMLAPALLLLIPASLPAASLDWHSHTTRYTFGAKPVTDYLADYQRHQSLQRLASQPGTHLYPESVGGNWNPLLTASWQSALQPGQTALIGGFIPESTTGLTNAVIELTATSERVVYRQQQPVPFLMWRPWDTSDPSAFVNHPASELPVVSGKRTAFLICYEHLISVPFLTQAAAQPAQLVAIGSNGFTPTYIRLAQQRGVEAWAQLFHLPTYTAFNQ